MASVDPEELPGPQELREAQAGHRDPEPDRHPEALATTSSSRSTSRSRSARTSACRASSRASSRSRTSPRPARSSSSRTTSRSRSTTSTSAAQRGMTFAAPIKVVIRLVVWDVNEETGVQSIRDVKEQEVYFGEIPLMTDARHVHHQRHRARHRLAAPPLARRVLRSRQGQDPLVAASCSTRPA